MSAEAAVEIPDADVIDEAPVGGELVHLEQTHDVSLWRAVDPEDQIAEASKLAAAFKDVVKRQGLIASIRGREHPQVEAWQLLGSMLGVHPVPVGEPITLSWPDPVPAALKGQHDRGLTFGFTASYLAVKNGETVGGGQSRCARSESTWKDRDDFALASMAQTRAISKALSGPLRFVMVLAGYQATPAEEMPQETAQAGPPLGPEFDKPKLGKDVAAACMKLVGGVDPEDVKARGIALFRLVAVDCDGYMPQAAALALLRAANTENIVPHIEAPDPS